MKWFDDIPDEGPDKAIAVVAIITGVLVGIIFLVTLICLGLMLWWAM